VEQESLANAKVGARVWRP